MTDAEFEQSSGHDLIKSLRRGGRRHQRTITTSKAICFVHQPTLQNYKKQIELESDSRIGR